MIPFNKPYETGNEIEYIKEAIANKKLSGNGEFTKRCQEFFEKKYGFNKCMLTTSCTDALEMAAILSNVSIDDEVIIPSYTFVSTALAFVRQGAKIVFIDSCVDNPNIDVDKIEELITNRTKAIVVVHYAGVACNMNKVMELASKYNITVIEDAAQAIDSYYLGKPLGSIGHLGCFSFHETKNITCGEGGMLTINDQKMISRAEVIWEKGTNRAEFYRGEINKYGWVDIGSSFLPSELNAAYLFAQLKEIDSIQSHRKQLWNIYYNKLNRNNLFSLPVLNNNATNNAHMFYIICLSLEIRTSLLEYLRKNGIFAVFHYQSLHCSKYYIDKHDGRVLENSDKFTNCLLRLPLYNDMTDENVDYIAMKINDFVRIYKER